MSLSAACNFTASASTVSATGTLYAAAGTLCTLALVDSTSVYHGDVSIDCDLIPEAGQQFRLNPHGWSAKFQLPPIDTVLDITITVSDVNGSTAQSQFNLVVVKDGQLAVTTFGADPTGSVDSLAAVNAAAAALSGTGVALLLTGGTYSFSAAPTIPANVRTVLGSGVTFPGSAALSAQRATIKATGVVSLPAKLFGVKGDGVTDDSVAIGAACLACATTGVALSFDGSNHVVGNGSNSGVDLSACSNLSIVCGAGTTFTANLPIAASLLNYVFHASLASGATSYGLHSDVAANAFTISTNVAPAVGSKLVLSDNGQQRGSTYNVEAVSGTGPYTVTLDRPTRLAFPAASSLCVSVDSQPTNIRLFGNGATFTGTCYGYIGLDGVDNCNVEDVNIVFGATTPGIGILIDTWSTRTKLDRFTVVGNNVNGTIGVQLSGTERCGLGDVWSVKRCQYGVLYTDCVDSGQGAGSSENNTSYGVQFLSYNNTGCLGCWARGGQAIGNGSHNVYVTQGCADTLVDGVTTNASQAGAGVMVDTVGAATVRTRVVNVTANYNNTFGIEITGTDPYVGNASTSYNGSAGVQFNSDGTINGLVAVGNGTTNPFTSPGLYANACSVRASNLKITVTVSGNKGVIGYGPCDLFVSGAEIALAAGAGNVQTAVYAQNAGSRVKVQGLLVNGTNVGDANAYGLYTDASAYIRLGHDVNVASCGNPTAGSGKFSFGTVATTNGATAVSFPDLRAQDTIVLTPTGAAPTAYVSATTPGTGFTVNDTGAHSYEWRIVG